MTGFERCATGFLLCAALGCSSGGGGGALVDGGAGQGATSGFGGTGMGGASGGSGGSGALGGSAGGGGTAASHTVFGEVQIVNPGSATSTSVILADAAFDPDVPSLVPPMGPKAMNVTGSWTIPNVPDGKYVVLVAWENDGLTLDPDPAIGGTSLVTIDVAGADVDAGSFKVTAALEVISPDGGQTAGLPLSFAWVDPGGDTGYELRLFDQSGALVYDKATSPPGSGAQNVVASYDGPALNSGMSYQFRAVKLLNGAPIARTENLRGVFLAP